MDNLPVGATFWDIMNQAPFRAVEVTAALENVAYVPRLLGGLGEQLFPTVPVRTRTVMVGMRDRSNTLIPVSPLGAPPVELELRGAKARSFATRRLAKGSTVYAEELQGILQQPLMQAVRSMVQEIANRATQIRADMEDTHEHMRFGCIQGIVTDADGTTVVDNWWDNWGISPPAVVNFALNDANANIADAIDDIRVAVMQASQGAWVAGRTVLHALAGTTFYKKLFYHPSRKNLYMSTDAAARLFTPEVPDMFEFGGVVWHRWMGLSASPFEIPATEYRMFPMGMSDMFQRIQGPGEGEPYLNEPGRDVYALQLFDRDRGWWTRTELYSYPLYICLRPHLLRKGGISA
jgi:hypothetical protein